MTLNQLCTEVNNIMSNSEKKSAPASITKAEVTSNADAGKTANLFNGILRM